MEAVLLAFVHVHGVDLVVGLERGFVGGDARVDALVVARVMQQQRRADLGDIVGAGLAYHVTEIFAVEGNFDFSPDLGEKDYKPLTRQLVDEKISYLVYTVTSIVLDIALGVLGMMVVAWFSRAREYRADAGAAVLSSRQNMIAALQRLKGAPSDLPKEMTAMGIASEAKDSLLSTHPTLDNRIERLKQM